MVLATAVLVSGCVTMPAAWPGDARDALSPEARAYQHYLLGVIHQRNGRFEEAAVDYREAVGLYPDSVALLRDLTYLYIRLQDYENAREMCVRALEYRPDDVGLWIQLGMTDWSLEAYEESALAFQKAVALNPNDPLSIRVLIEATEKTNDMVGQLDLFERLVSLHPDSGALHYHLGLRLARVNDTEAARDALEKALSLDPNLTDARQVLGIVYLDLGDDEAASGQFRRAVTADPKNARAGEYLAGVLCRLGRYDEALEVLSAILESDEAEPIHAFERMYVLLRLERFADAAAVPALEEAPILSAILLEWAKAQTENPAGETAGEFDAVRGDIDLECQQFLGELLYLFGREDVAAYFEGVLGALREAGPPSKAVDTALARVLMAVESDEEAEVLLREALETHGPDKWLHYYLAELYERGGELDAAEEHLESTLEIDPNDPEVLNFLGYLYADADMKLDRAERLLLRAINLDPENGFYLDSLGWIYYRKGKAQKAIEFIRRAILAMDSDDAVLRDHLGDAYLLKGEVDKAVSQWERALRLDRELEGVQEKIDRHGRQRATRGGD